MVKNVVNKIMKNIIKLLKKKKKTLYKSRN